MNRPDMLEFYDDNGLVLRISSSMVPPVDSKVCIKNTVYKVTSITYAADYTDSLRDRQMRANINLKVVK